METISTVQPRARRRSGWLAVAAAGVVLALPATVQAQGIVMAGNYQNFDVLNNTGGPTCGFEMEVWGVSASQLTRIFPSNWNAGVIRYGFGKATDFPGGTIVHWASPYDANTGQFTSCTPVPPSLTTVPGDSCWTLGMPSTYKTAGCEHFGISTTYGVNPTKINYRWLAADPANPALPPVVVAEIPAPPPAPEPVRFGEAQWVRVYKAEHAAKVDAVDDLVGDNPALVPKEAGQLEVSWSLLQADPPALAGNQRRRGKLVNQGNLGNGNHAVVRRYEFYKYAGVYDPVTHEALCADLTCTAPGPGELGDAIGAQNVAANLDVNALSVTVAGGGSVSSSDKVFSCGNKCYGVYNPGTTVTLTAKANSGSTFSGWSGACAGANATCTVTLNAESAVTATFVAVVAGGGGGGGGGVGGGGTYKLSIGRSNAGIVTSDPLGITCGSTCSAKFTAGSIVTLTATPPAGKTFVGWGGACSGTAPLCSLNLTGDASVQATFSK